MKSNDILSPGQNGPRGKASFWAGIGVLGLGMALCFILAGFIGFEKSYDTFFKDPDRIFRVITEKYAGGKLEGRYGNTMQLVGPKLQEDFPGIEKAARLYPYYGMILEAGKNKLLDRKVYAADPSFLDVFSLKMLKVSQQKTLKDLRTMVIDRSSALLLFGDSDPLEKPVRVKWGIHTATYKIIGVFEDIPGNSHFRVNALTSFTDVSRWSFFDDKSSGNWHYPWFQTYVKLTPGADAAVLEQKFPGFIRKYAGDAPQKYGQRKIFLQRLTDIHLGPKLKWAMGSKGNGTLLAIFFGAAILILVFALSGFYTLAAGYLFAGPRETTVHQGGQSDRRHSFKAYFFRPLWGVFFAALLALLLVVIFADPVHDLLGATAPLPFFDDIWFWVVVAAAVLSCGAILTVVSVRRYGSLGAGDNRGAAAPRPRLLRALGHLEVGLAFFLMVGMFVVDGQVDFLLHSSPGFNHDRVVVFDPVDRHRFNSLFIYLRFGDALRELPGVESAAFSAIVPGLGHQTAQAVWRNDKAEKVNSATSFVDYNFFDTLEIKFLAGRNFALKSFNEDLQGVIVNESLARLLGFAAPADAIGEFLEVDGALKSYIKPGKHRIIGVVADFHQHALKRRIKPAKFHLIPVNKGKYSIKLARGAPADETVEKIEALAAKFFFRTGFRHYFLTERLAEEYEEDVIVRDVTRLGALVFLFMMLVGLWGGWGDLPARSGPVRSAAILYLQRVLPAAVVGLLAAYPVFKNFLDAYPYRVEAAVSVWLLPVSIILAVSLPVLGFRVIKSRREGPRETRMPG